MQLFLHTIIHTARISYAFVINFANKCSRSNDGKPLAAAEDRINLNGHPAAVII